MDGIFGIMLEYNIIQIQWWMSVYNMEIPLDWTAYSNRKFQPDTRICRINYYFHKLTFSFIEFRFYRNIQLPCYSTFSYNSLYFSLSLVKQCNHIHFSMKRGFKGLYWVIVQTDALGAELKKKMFTNPTITFEIFAINRFTCEYWHYGMQTVL